MSIFRASSTPAVPLIVSVTGVRLGQRVLVVPGSDRRVLFDLAARVGLTGRTLALTAGDAAELRAICERHGSVVDVDALALPLPADDGSIDVAVLDERTARSGSSPEVTPLVSALLTALRPGGRLIVLLPAGGGLLSRLFRTSEPPPAAPAMLELLARAGFRSGRMVAVVEGVAYLEGTRAAT